MYFLLLFIWITTLYIGIKILISQVFNKSFSILILTKKIAKRKYNINIIKRVFNLKVFQLLNSLLSEISKLLEKSSPIVKLLLYTLFLLLITVISQLILLEETPVILLSLTIIMLATLVIIIITIILINFFLSFFVLSITSFHYYVQIL